MVTLVSLHPPSPFISQVVYTKPSPTLFPSSGMLSSLHQAPLPVWSNQRPCVFLRFAPWLTITGRSPLRMAARLKTCINVPHQWRVLPVHRQLLLDPHLSSNSDTLSYHMAVQAVPTSHLIASDHAGPHWMTQKTGAGIKTSNQERSVEDTASTTSICWRRPSLW